MNKFYFLLYKVVLVLIGIMLFVHSSCKFAKSKQENDIGLVRLKNKAALFSQNQPSLALKYADSAITFFKTVTVDDSLTIELIALKADIYIALGQSDSAYNTILAARNQAIISANEKIQAFSDLWLGQQFTENGKYFMAGKYIKEGLALSEKIGNEYQIARSYNLYGSYLSFNGNYEEAQEYLIKATGLFEKLGNIKALGAVYNNIATNFDATNDNEKTMFFFKKALHFSFQQSDTVNIISTLNNLGIHYRPSKPDSAEFYFTEALKFHQSIKGDFEIISVKFNLANLYFDRKEFNKAMELYKQVMDICTTKGIYSGLARTYNGIGNIYEAQNADIKAMNYYQKAHRIADSINETPVAMVFLSNIQYMYEKTRDFEQALVSLKEIKKTNDSLLSFEKQIAVHDLEMLYNNEKTEKENTELNTKVLLQKSSLRTNHIILSIVFVSLVGLVIFLSKIYNLYRQRDEAYKNLLEKYRSDSLNKGSEDSLRSVKILIPEAIPYTNDPDYQKLVNYFDTQKPFLKSDLHFDDVALYLKINRKLLSNLLSKHAGMNFKTFVNGYRIREAIRLLAEPEFQNYKIEAIAKLAGFGSKASFYTAFGNTTGSKPSEHR